MGANGSKIGFIGIGNMGWPMARNLVRAGHELTVYDADAARTARFAAEYGVSGATTIAGLAAAEIIITMLPTGQVVRDLYLASASGLASHLRPGSVAIDMSSSDPGGTRRLGHALAASKIALLDAPVSGGVPRAESGMLTIMLGGDDPAVIERAKGVLAVLGNPIFGTGALGTGHAMKALNNFVAAAGYCAAAEALAMGVRFGLDASRMLEILNASTGRNFNTEVVMKEHLVDGKFATGFALGLMAKDVKAAADLGAELRVAAPLSVLMNERWKYALQQLGATRDFSAAALAWDSPPD